MMPGFKRSLSIPQWREMLDRTAKLQRIPAGTDIHPITVHGVPAEWVSAANARPDTAVLYLHGGAMVMSSPATHRELAGRLSAASGARFLVLDYRLAPEHPFPAALQDTLSTYHWLLDNSYPAERVVLGADSAGAGLALQTLLTLKEKGGQLPAATFLQSPVADWVRFDGESYTTRAQLEIMYTEEMCRFTSSLYVGDNDPANPIFYPIGMDLAGLPPLCLHVGDHELVLSDSIQLAERARAAGVEVEFKIWPHMWHVFQTMGSLVPEARQSIAEIGRFVARHI